MRTAGLAKLILGIALVSVLVGCTSLWNPRNVTPPPAEVDFKVTPQAAQNFDYHCLSFVTGRQADAILSQAVTDPQFQQLQQRLEAQGFNPNFNAAKVYSGPQCALALVPIGPQANLYYMRTPLGASVTAVTSQGRRRIELQPEGTIREVLLLTRDQVRGILAQVSDVLRQRGITKGYVWASIDEANQEVLLVIKDRQALYLATLEALTWSESGPVTIGIVKHGPVRVSCRTSARVSSEPNAHSQLTPLGSHDSYAQFTPCDGDSLCGGSSPTEYFIRVECFGGELVCISICEIDGYGLRCGSRSCTSDRFMRLIYGCF
jgi:hypothetical protein